MKTNFFAILLCGVMVFSLAACGGDEDTESKNTSAVSDTTSGDSETGKTGDKDIGGIILPEEGKINFGEDNKKSEETMGTETDGNSKDGSAESDGKDIGKESGKSNDNEKSTGDTTPETAKPSGDNDGTPTETTGSGDSDYGGIKWNN